MKRIFLLPIFLLLLTSCNSSNKLVWQWTLESRCYAQPIIDGNNVYVVSQSGEVVSGEYRTGKKNWSIKVNGPVLGDPDFDQDKVYVATQNGFVLALKKRKWKRKLERQLSGRTFHSPPDGCKRYGFGSFKKWQLIFPFGF